MRAIESRISLTWKIFPSADFAKTGSVPHLLPKAVCSFRRASYDGTLETWHSFRIQRIIFIRLLDTQRRGRLSIMSSNIV
jgi:hypothetical protein